MKLRTFNYGSFSFNWIFAPADIKTHQIVVEKDKTVTLRGKELPLEQLETLIKKKARWIREEVNSMKSISATDIVSGSRLKYLGRSYMVLLELSDSELGAAVTFSGMKFQITVNSKVSNPQELIKHGIKEFQRKKALEKIYPRIKHFEKVTGLSGCGRRIRVMDKRWGSCTTEGLIEINPKVIELSPKLIDYIIVHELCHTVEFNHTKEFWNLLTQHYPNWLECHNILEYNL